MCKHLIGTEITFKAMWGKENVTVEDKVFLKEERETTI